MTTRTRVIVDIILLVGTLTLPWWMVLPATILCLFAFKNFYEIFAVGFILDNLYGVTAPWLPVPFLYLFISAVLFVVVSLLKRRLKFDF